MKCAVLVLACVVQMAKGADPLDNWTTSNPGGQYTLQNMAFGKGLFVSAGDSGTIVTSPNGVTWAQRNSGTTTNLGAIAYGGGQFAVSGGGQYSFITSPDGVTWTPHNIGGNIGAIAIAYGSSRFVGAGAMVRTDSGAPTNAAIISSADGVNWTPWSWTSVSGRFGDPMAFSDIVYGNTQFLAISSTPSSSSIASVATSPDGITWTQHLGVNLGQGAGKLAFGNGLFVAVGGYQGGNGALQPLNHAVIWTSPDGLDWTQRGDYTNGVDLPGFTFVSYGGGQFVAGGTVVDGLSWQLYPMIYSSADGTNWVSHDVQVALSALAFGNGQFVGIGGSTAMQSGVIGKLSASLSPGTGVRGAITGVTGQQYAIEASANLVTWKFLTNVTVTNGTAQFSDASPTNVARKFYGALLVK